MDRSGCLLRAEGQVSDEIDVRVSRSEDAPHAEEAGRMIAEASREHDIALRDVEWLRTKIESGRAAIALRGDELVGFGYWSEWEDGRFVSHSGLVVDPGLRGGGLGRRLKTVLLEESRRRFPRAFLMSLTTSEPVKKMNLSLGFHVVPLDRLTTDPAFWEGCKGCPNYEDVQRRGEKCCCEGLILEPEEVA